MLPNDEGWFRELPRQLLRYAGIKDLREYIQRVSETYPPPLPAPVRSMPSPLELVASLDYFNAVWQLRYGRPVVRIFNAERIARLAFPVSGSDEFMGQVATLGEVLRDLQVSGDPTTDKTALGRLRTVLAADLPEAGAVRANQAVAMLSHVAELRNSLVHTGTEYQSARALPGLGVEYPITDWAEAWSIVQERVIDALAALREEIQLSSPEGPLS